MEWYSIANQTILVPIGLIMYCLWFFSQSAPTIFSKVKSYFVLKCALSKIFPDCTNEQGTLKWWNSFYKQYPLGGKVSYNTKFSINIIEFFFIIKSIKWNRFKELLYFLYSYFKVLSNTVFLAVTSIKLLYCFWVGERIDHYWYGLTTARGTLAR